MDASTGILGAVSNNLSGTWKWMGGAAGGPQYEVAIACRVA
jgi:hypothetical protein